MGPQRQRTSETLHSEDELQLPPDESLPLPGNSDILRSSLQNFPVFYYRESFFQSENVTLHWHYSPDPASPCFSSDSIRYEIKLYPQNEIDRAESPQELIANQIFTTRNTTVTIPHYENENYFQISAFAEKNIHCSDSTNLEKFINYVDVLYDSMNKVASFELSDDLRNRSLQLIWSKSNTTQCVCPPVGQFISRCACNMEYPNNTITIVNNTLTVSNLTLNMGETFLYFVSSVSSGCHGTCNLRSLVRPYGIITTQGFPAAPIINYLENGTFCFTIPSNSISAEVYEVNLTDSTGSQAELSSNYNMSACLSITSDLYPDVCGPFQLSVTAINGVGRETTQKTIVTTDSRSTPCNCYRRKGKNMVDITSTTESNFAKIRIDCNRSDNFIVTVTEADNSSIIVQHYNMSCNVTQTIDSLQPSTNYSASVVIEEQLMCTQSINFMTSAHSGYLGLILGSLCPVILGIIVFIIVVPWVKYFKRENIVEEQSRSSDPTTRDNHSLNSDSELDGL